MEAGHSLAPAAASGSLSALILVLSQQLLRSCFGCRLPCIGYFYCSAALGYSLGFGFAGAGDCHRPDFISLAGALLSLCELASKLG